LSKLAHPDRPTLSKTKSKADKRVCTPAIPALRRFAMLPA